jgi:hypothetical protein
MKEWDDKGARDRMKKACIVWPGIRNTKVFARVCKALNYGMQHSDAPVIADEIVNAIFNAFDLGREHERKCRGMGQADA